eukprot:227265_1
MGNEHNNNDTHSENETKHRGSVDIFKNLFHNKRKSSHPNSTQKHKLIEKKPKLPTCPICFMECKNYKRLKNCNHLICHDCLKAYISTDLKNISKYPLSCFQSNCDKLLDFSDVEYALNFNKDLLFIFDKFSILCAISPKEREQCPKCDMVFFYQSKWLREKAEPFKWIKDEERVKCASKLCDKKFLGFIIRRHHCRMCGEIFCDNCSSNELPLSATSNQMLKTWMKTNKYKEEESHNRRASVVKAKKWLKNVAASSTSHELELSSSDEDNDKEYEEKKYNDKEYGNSAEVMQSKANEDKKQEEKKEGMPELVLTVSEENLIEEERVRCCYECWLDYYRGVCAECDYTYCIQCRQEWHNNYDCEAIKQRKKEINLRKKLQDAQTEELMLREGWRRCSGCKVWVAKTEGCNHMTHENCPKPNELETKKCHFCYCCGELLYDPYHKHEKNGKLHFENGVFNECRNNDKAQQIREKLHDNVKENIEKIENEFDENGLIVKDDTLHRCESTSFCFPEFSSYNKNETH